MVVIKNGTLDDFFDSALQTAKEIDERQKVTPKHTIWMETKDLLDILKPQRTSLIKYLRGKTKVYYQDLLRDLHKSPSGLNKDLELLQKYKLIEVTKEPNSGHGVRKVIVPLLGNDPIEFKAVV
jgi:predicted transcriptional regulator